MFIKLVGEVIEKYKIRENNKIKIYLKRITRKLDKYIEKCRNLPYDVTTKANKRKHVRLIRRK